MRLLALKTGAMRPQPGMQRPPEAGKATAVFPAGFRGNLDFVPVTLIFGLQTCAIISLFQGNPV